MFKTFEIDSEGEVFQIGPEGGFTREGYACAYAREKASESRPSMTYVVVANSEVIVAYPGGHGQPSEDEECMGEAA